MTKNNWSIIIIILAALLSCGRQKSEVCSRLAISIDKVQEPGMSELFEQFVFVKLETTDSCLMKTPIKTLLHDSIIYVSDGLKIYKYDLNGFHLQTIHHFGKAANEYIEITDFNILASNEILVLDGLQKKLIHYSASGMSINTHKIDKWVSSFGLLNDSLIVFNNSYTNEGGSNKFSVFNFHSMIEIGSFQPINPKKSNYMHFLGQNNFSKHNGKLLFNESMESYIYEITADGVSPVCDIKINDKSPSETFWEEDYRDVRDFMNKFNAGGYVNGTSIYAEGIKSLLFRYQGSSDSNICIYDKKSGESIHFNSIIIDENLEAVQAYDMTFTPQTDGIIILNIPAFSLTKSTVPAFEGMSVEDNPVVCIATLK